MDVYSDWGATLADVFTQLAQRIASYLPNLIGAVVLLAVGWVVARVLRSLAMKLIQLVELAIFRLSRREAAERSRLPPTSGKIFAGIVFWIVILFFLTAATKTLGLDVFVEWLNRIVNYLPTLFAGALIVVAGYLVSRLARDLVIATATPVTQSQRLLLGRTVQIIILVTAIVIGADQVGIKITFLVIMATVVASTLLGGAALAVSLGAQTYVKNLIGGHYLRQSYRVGQTVRFGNLEGRILELTATGVLLETSEGRALLPAKLFHEEPSLLLVADNHRAPGA